MTGIYQLANFVSNLAISLIENHTAIQANPFYCFHPTTDDIKNQVCYQHYFAS
jgi:hypothetical protein